MRTSRIIVLVACVVGLLGALTVAQLASSPVRQQFAQTKTDGSLREAMPLAARSELEARQPGTPRSGAAHDDSAGKHAEAPTASPLLPRKIIYDATLELVADDLGKAEEDLRILVKHLRGYISKSELRGVAGTQRHGFWTIRVPVENFDAFREGTIKLGEIKRDSIDSQDVTDQFYDLEARIKANKAEEEALRHMLEQTRDLNHKLQVRAELNRIQAELQVQQGQMQRLDKLTTLATYTVTIHERKSYVPPESMTFGTRLERTFGGSLGALREFGEGATLVAAALAPWLPLAFLVVAPFWVTVRRRTRPLPLAQSLDQPASA